MSWCRSITSTLPPRRATGTFLMVYEPTRKDGETRDEYLQWFRRVNRTRWTMLTPDEWAHNYHQLTTSDFPETQAGWRDLPAPMRIRPASIACSATTGNAPRLRSCRSPGRGWQLHQESIEN